MIFRKKMIARSPMVTPVKGRKVETYSEPFEIMASKHPTNEQTIKLLPEGRREKVSYTLYSNDELRTLDNGNPDQVKIDDSWYEVVKKLIYTNTILAHHKYLVVEL